MFDLSKATLIHEFGWRFRDDRPLAFTNSGDQEFAAVISRYADSMLRIGRGGFACRQYVHPARSPEYGNGKYDTSRTVIPLGNQTLTAAELESIHQSLLLMLGKCWGEMILWVLEACPVHENKLRPFQVLYPGTLFPVRWTPYTRLEEEVRLCHQPAPSLVLRDPPSHLGFPLCAKRMLEHNIRECLRDPAHLTTPPAEA